MWRPPQGESGIPEPGRSQGEPLTKALVNLSAVDRTVRILLGAMMLAAAWWMVRESLGKAGLEVFAWFPLATGALGWDPVYAILGIRTNRRPAPGNTREKTR